MVATIREPGSVKSLHLRKSKRHGAAATTPSNNTVHALLLHKQSQLFCGNKWHHRDKDLHYSDWSCMAKGSRSCIHGQNWKRQIGGAWCGFPSGHPHKLESGCSPATECRWLHTLGGSSDTMMLFKGVQRKRAPPSYKALLQLKAGETQEWYWGAGQPHTDTACCQKLLWHKRAGVSLSEKTCISRKHSKNCFKTKDLLDSLQGFLFAQ